MACCRCFQWQGLNVGGKLPKCSEKDGIRLVSSAMHTCVSQIYHKHRARTRFSTQAEVETFRSHCLLVQVPSIAEPFLACGEQHEKRLKPRCLIFQGI